LFSNLPQHFNSIDKIKPLYNVDDYAKESKFRLEQILDLDFGLKIGDQVLLKNETGHKLDFKYTVPYNTVP